MRYLSLSNNNNRALSLSARIVLVLCYCTCFHVKQGAAQRSWNQVQNPVSESEYTYNCDTERANMGYTITTDSDFNVRYYTFASDKPFKIPPSHMYIMNYNFYTIFDRSDKQSDGVNAYTPIYGTRTMSWANAAYFLRNSAVCGYNVEYQGMTKAVIMFKDRTTVPNSDASKRNDDVQMGCQCGYVLVMFPVQRSINCRPYVDFYCLKINFRSTLINPVANSQYPDSVPDPITMDWLWNNIILNHQCIPGYGLSQWTANVGTGSVTANFYQCIPCDTDTWSAQYLGSGTCIANNCGSGKYVYSISLEKTTPPVCRTCGTFTDSDVFGDACSPETYNREKCLTLENRGGVYDLSPTCNVKMPWLEARGIYRRTNGATVPCLLIAAKTALQNLNNPLQSTVLTRCGKSSTNEAIIQTGTCDKFVLSGYFMFSCADGLADIRSCTDTVSRKAFEAQGFGWRGCGEQANLQLGLGPGEKIACNDAKLKPTTGSYIGTCNAESGIVYKSCVTDRPACPTGSFLVLCGVHVSDVILNGYKTGIYENDLSMNSALNNFYTGKCISCADWAPARCPAMDDVLVECGRPTTEIVDPRTWFGTASGRCTTCSTLGPATYCPTTIQDAVAQNSAYKFYRTGCNTKLQLPWQASSGSGSSLVPAVNTLGCTACAVNTVCPSGQKFDLCGGTNAGSCQACVLPVGVTNNIQYHGDGLTTASGFTCVWSCKPGYTGRNCDTACLQLTCAPGERLIPCSPPYQAYCRTDPRVPPANSISNTAWETVIIDEVAAGFDNIVFWDYTNGVALNSPLTISQASSSASSLRATSASLNPAQRRWYSAGALVVRKCADNTINTDTAHPVHPHYCDDSKGNAFAVLSVDSTTARFLRLGFIEQSNCDQCYAFGVWVRGYSFGTGSTTPDTVTVTITAGLEIASSQTDVTVADLSANLANTISITASLRTDTWKFLHWNSTSCTNCFDSNTKTWYKAMRFRFTASATCSIALDSFMVWKTSLFFSTWSIDGAMDTLGGLKANGRFLSDTVSPSSGIAVARSVRVNNGYVSLPTFFSNGYRLRFEVVANGASIPPTAMIEVWQNGNLFMSVPLRTGMYETFVQETSSSFFQTLGCRIVATNGGDMIITQLIYVSTGFPAWRCNSNSLRSGARCVPCSAQLSECPSPVQDYYVTGCTANGLTRAAQCARCNTVVTDPNAVFLLPLPGATSTECNTRWTCKQDFILEMQPSGGGAQCVPCNKNLDCAVGFYRRACWNSYYVQDGFQYPLISPEAQSTCVPCTNIVRAMTLGVEQAVYTAQSPAYGLNDCPYKCNTGYYRSGPNCIQCSSDLRCPRRRLVPCSEASDAYCADCVLDPALNREVVYSRADTTFNCPTACKPGFVPCTPCAGVPYRTVFVINDVRSLTLLNTANPLATIFWLNRGSNTVRVRFDNTYLITFSNQIVNGVFVLGYLADPGKNIRFQVDAGFSGVETQYVQATISFEIAAERSPGSTRIRTVMYCDATKANTNIEHTYDNINIVSDGAAFKRYSCSFSGKQTAYVQVTTADGTKDQLKWIYVRNITASYVISDAEAPCLACNRSNGQLCIDCATTQYPDNAEVYSLQVPDPATRSYCAWRCREGFVATPTGAGCTACAAASCGVGFYQNDCGTCAACNTPPNARLTSPGGAYSTLQGSAGPDSCSYECDTPGAWGSRLFGVLTCHECSAGLECAAGEWQQNCSDTQDAVCVPCSTQCDPGFAPVAECSAFADLQCEPCPNTLPPGATWTRHCEWACLRPGLSAAEYLFRPDTGECITCQPECAVGQYNSTCDAQTRWKGCRDCALPLGPVVALTSGWHRYGCQWRCADGFRFDATADSCIAALAPAPVPPVCGDSATATKLACPPGFVSQLDAGSNECVCKACSAQATKPPHTVWIASLRCEWACVPPFVRNHDQCVQFVMPDKSPPGTGGVPGEGGGAAALRYDNVSSRGAPTAAAVTGSLVPLGVVMLLCAAFVLRQRSKRSRRRRQQQQQQQQQPPGSPLETGMTSSI